MNAHRPRVLLLILLLTCAGIAMTGCGTPGRFDQGDELRLAPGMNDVCDIHDEYVSKDASLDTNAKATAIAQSVILRDAFKQPSFDAEPIDGKATAVLDRTEAYIKADGTLSPATRNMYKTAVAGVRRGFDAAMKREGPASKPGVKPAAAPPNPAPASSPATTSTAPGIRLGADPVTVTLHPVAGRSGEWSSTTCPDGSCSAAPPLEVMSPR